MLFLSKMDFDVLDVDCLFAQNDPAGAGEHYGGRGKVFPICCPGGQIPQIRALG